MNSKILKTAIFLIIAFFFITSKMFNQHVLKNIPGALEYENPTDKGWFVGSFCLAFVYILISMCIQAEIL